MVLNEWKNDELIKWSDDTYMESSGVSMWCMSKKEVGKKLHELET